MAWDRLAPDSSYDGDHTPSPERRGTGTNYRQLCGLGHYRMKGFVTIHNQERFDPWVAEWAAEAGDDETGDFWNRFSSLTLAWILKRLVETPPGSAGAPFFQRSASSTSTISPTVAPWVLLMRPLWSFGSMRRKPPE